MTGISSKCGAAPRINGSLLERFEAKYIRVPESGCWLWTAAVDERGYGILKSNEYLAHRVAWQLYHGPIPSGLYVLHRCDVRCCVNALSHLFLGTQRDNIQDMIKKGRAVVLAGEDKSAAKLTNESVLAIRAAVAAGEGCSSLARRYHVHNSVVSRVATRKRWTHI